MTGKLIQWGFVASREEANYVLIGIAVLAVLATIFVLRSF